MVYHYTIADRLRKILASGYIDVMEEKSKVTEDEICLCWLTTSTEWDKTAFYRYPEKLIDSYGRVRILIDKAYFSHTFYSKNMPQIKELEESALSIGVNPDDWRVSTTPIPISDFSKIEYWNTYREMWIDTKIIQR